nr:5366_t:CDS:2 [Entrophospora candida]
MLMMNDLLNEEEIISMSNFNEENQDEEDIEETSPISSQDALFTIEKTVWTVH